MKKVIGICSLIFLLSFPLSSQAYTIIDNYWGANGHGYGDVVGRDDYFDISKMEVNYSGGILTVDIYSRYFDNIGIYGTLLGDLFISTNGWNPYGTPPNYPQDNYINGGEIWEYVLVLNNHTAQSGSLNLYKLSDGGTITLSYAPSGYIWRDGQEVLFNPTGSSIATGIWSIYGLGTPIDTDDYLRFVISNSNWGGGNPSAFHWGMTCANDTIEGAVPEPATMLLLGSGLLGLAGFARRRFKK